MVSFHGVSGYYYRTNGDTVHGYLFYSNNLCDHWDFLDVFEGEEFVRMPVTVERYDELDVNTYIYVLKEDKEHLEE